ncbi:hypothetical protein D3C87_988340 [compost metagenome]
MSLAILGALPGTASDVAAFADISLAGAYRHLAKLVDDGAAHVGSWRAVGEIGRLAAVYVAGPGTEAPKPTRAKPSTVRVRRWRNQRVTSESSREFGAGTAGLQGAIQAMFSPG